MWVPFLHPVLTLLCKEPCRFIAFLLVLLLPLHHSTQQPDTNNDTPPASVQNTLTASDLEISCSANPLLTVQHWCTSTKLWSVNSVACSHILERARQLCRDPETAQSAQALDQRIFVDTRISTETYHRFDLGNGITPHTYILNLHLSVAESSRDLCLSSSLNIHDSDVEQCISSIMAELQRVYDQVTGPPVDTPLLPDVTPPPPPLPNSLLPIRIKVSNPLPFTQVSSNLTVTLSVVAENPDVVENQQSLQQWLYSMMSAKDQQSSNSNQVLNLHVCLSMSSLHFPLDTPIRRIGCLAVFDIITSLDHPSSVLVPIPIPVPIPVRLSSELDRLQLTRVPYGEHDLVVDVHADDGSGSPGMKIPSGSTTVRVLSTPIIAERTKVGLPYARRSTKDYLTCAASKSQRQRQRKRQRKRQRQRQQRRVSKEFAQAYRTHQQQSMAGTVTMGVLVHRGATSFANSVKSWYDSNLVLCVSEILVYLQEWPFPDDGLPRSLAEVATMDARLAPMLLLLLESQSQSQSQSQTSYSMSFPNILVLGAPHQVNIAPALSRLVEASSSELFMFIEEDFIIAGTSITQTKVQERLKEATQLLLSSFESVDVVRLRSRRFPGVPDCAHMNWKGREEEMLRVRSADIARHKVLDSTGWLTNPYDYFPKGVVWQCVPSNDGSNESSASGEESSKNAGNDDDKRWWCAHSTHAGWTNNPFIVRREWMWSEIVPIANVDWTRRVESAVCLSPPLWDHACYSIAAGEGIFTHRDSDQPLEVQSPCEKSRTELLPAFL